MSKVYLVDIPHEPGIRGLVGDGKLLKFQFGGKCTGEFPIDFNLGSLQEVDVVSILVAGNNIELGFSINNCFSKKLPLLSLADIANRLNNLNGLVFVGLKEGVLNSTNYRQYLYVFLKNSVDISIF